MITILATLATSKSTVFNHSCQHAYSASEIQSLNIMHQKSKKSCDSDFGMKAYVESIVTQISSTQSTQRSLCSTGTTPYVIRWANGHSFQPAWKTSHIKGICVKTDCIMMHVLLTNSHWASNFMLHDRSVQARNSKRSDINCRIPSWIDSSNLHTKYQLINRT